MHARLFLAWLAIAIIAVVCQRDEYYDDELEDPDGIPLKVRSALAEEALGVLHELGEDVDVSLDGYDHDLVARDLPDEGLVKGHESRDAGLDHQAMRKLGRMKPHYVQHPARDVEEEIEEDDDTPDVELDPEDEDEDEYEDEDDVTFENIVPDPDGEGEELAQPPLAARGLEDQDVDDSEEVYEEEDDEDEDEIVEPGSYDSGLAGDDQEIDYSLEGYDPSVLRRDETEEYDDYEDEDDEDEEDDYFDEEDFDFNSFLSDSPDAPADSFGAKLSERDIAADADEDFAGTTEEWLSDETRNARYRDEEAEPTVVVGKPLQFKRDIVEEVYPEDDEDEEDEEDEDGAFSRAWSQVRRWAEDLLT